MIKTLAPSVVTPRQPTGSAPRAPALTPSLTLAAKMLGMGVILCIGASGCQPNAPSESQKDPSAQTDTQNSSKDPAAAQPSVATPSSDAAARIDAYEPKFVEQMINLQQRLQAEYEAIEVADDASADDMDQPDSRVSSEVKSDEKSSISAASNEKTAQPKPDNSAAASEAGTPAQSSDAEPALIDEIVQADASKPLDIKKINANASDLTILKQVSLEPRAPEILSEDEIKERYWAALSELYGNEPLSAQAVNTLINISTLLPDFFEQSELAARLSDKSPALARLIVQHQVWRQIEAQQVLDMQKMKLEQQAEFETLMAKFNETIQGYDEQIGKYEKMLKEYEKK